MNNNQIEIHPIGRVKSGKGVFQIHIGEEYRAGLLGLEGFSHIAVIWWAHLFDKEEYRKILQTDKPYVKGPDRVGIYATRSPIRPNPIGISHAPVLSIDLDGGIITVPYIDTEEDTPVLDIKPYHPSEDRIREAKVPAWCSHWPKYYEESGNFDWNGEFNY